MPTVFPIPRAREAHVAAAVLAAYIREVAST